MFIAKRQPSFQYLLLSSQCPDTGIQFLLPGIKLSFLDSSGLCCIATYERLTIARIISNLLKILFFYNQSDQI
ncbi:hypothetical protein [Wolbachia endosymbiont (group A) of Hedychridium roseum]|uniref:hypothetical protein n=1 Tax=Wolbachia endosymbiont (group A) of Hedychridium roseum TaxID=3077921 RepID=UPI00334255E5